LSDVNPDLLITDLYLPTKSAFELARFMKAEQAYRDIPIVFAASPADTFDEQDARNAGADVVLRKPFEASALLQAVQTLLEKRAQLKPASPAATKPGLDKATIRAAVILALDSAMPIMIEELTERVILALSHK
jgi:DNA-binding response OmpR family regulator